MAVTAKPLSTVFLPFMLFIATVTSAFAADEKDPHVIEEARDFSEIGRVIGEKQLPLVLMFSADFCVFCKRLENDFLIPMQISGDYVDRAVIRKLKIDYGNTIRDFNGEKVDASEFARRYNVSVTPTLVFLDRHGNQLAAKQVGLTTPDFYGGYLDASIATALDLLRRTTPLRARID